MLALSAGANAGSRSLDQLDIAAGIDHVHAKPCKKFELPDPLKHQCQHATSQAPMSSRPRTHNKSDFSDVAAITIRPLLRKGLSVDVIALTTDVRRASRRSSFWQVFAYSARLRR